MSLPPSKQKGTGSKRSKYRVERSFTSALGFQDQWGVVSLQDNSPTHTTRVPLCLHASRPLPVAPSPNVSSLKLSISWPCPGKGGGGGRKHDFTGVHWGTGRVLTSVLSSSTEFSMTELQQCFSVYGQTQNRMASNAAL